MDKFNRESAISPEYEQKPASIRLEFFRHDEKAKATTSGDRTGDEFVRLTPQGRVNATTAGKIKEPHAEVAITFGSPRQRSIESGLRQMLANEDAVTPGSTLEDIRSLVDEQLKVGKKDRVLTELNFDWDTNKEFHDIAYPRFLESKDALSFLYHDSDKLVGSVKDSTSSSYSRAAGNFAKMVQKYLDILPRWKEIVKENPEKYSQFGNQMERYFGSHAAALEPFLMKVMEKTQGSEAVEEFLKGPKKNGFAPSEGYTVTILETKDRPQIIVKYGDKTWQLAKDKLAEIIKEGEELEKQISK